MTENFDTYLKSKQSTGDQANPGVERVKVNRCLVGLSDVLRLDGDQHAEAHQRNAEHEEYCVGYFVANLLAAKIRFVDEHGC